MIRKDLFEQGDNEIGGFSVSCQPVFGKGLDHEFQGFFNLLVNGLQAFQQGNALGIGGTIGVEYADSIKMFAKFKLPLVKKARFLLLVVDNGHAWTSGEPQDFHLCPVHVAHRT